MIWDDLFEALLKEIAAQLDLGFSKTRAGYTLSKNNILIGFLTFVGRDGKLKILMSPRLSGKPIDLGNYTKDELKGRDSKARKTLVVKITEEISKQ